MWWNVLIIPRGIRYKTRADRNSDIGAMVDDYKSITYRAKVKFTCQYGKIPDNLGWQEREKLDDVISKGKVAFSNKHSIDLVPDRILEMIRSTEPEHLDILLDLDVNDQGDFGRKYDDDEQGALDLFGDANAFMLVHSAWPSIKQGLMKDYRYSKLSEEGKKLALERAESESRMQDAEKINEWTSRLQASIEIRNKRIKPSLNIYASVFDGLK